MGNAARRQSLPKAAAFALLGSPPANAWRLRRIAGAGVATILSLHRVAPYDRSTYPPLDPQLFRRLLTFCRERFAIVTFAELQAGEKWRKPPMVLSFDDGYRDFVDYSAPILDEFKLRCNHNLIPTAIEQGRPPFNVLLSDYIGQAPDEHLGKLEIPGFARFDPAAGRDAFGAQLSAWVKGRPMADQRRIEVAVLPQVALFEEFRPTAIMSKDEARQIAGIHEVGAHSMEHANLGQETDDYVTQDAHRCKAWFRSELGLDAGIYAVPNGDYRPHQLDLIGQAGFATILLVGQKFSRPAGREHFRFNFDAISVPEMRFKALGGLASVN